MGGRKKSEGVIYCKQKGLAGRESERERRNDVDEGTVVAVAKC